MWGAFAFDVSVIGPGMIPVAALLLVVGWSIALFVIGLVLRFGTGAEAFAWGILFVVMPLSGAFYPVEALPSVLQPLALVLPTTYAFAVGRSVAAGDPFPWGQFVIGAVGTVGARRGRSGVRDLDAARLPPPRLRHPLLLRAQDPTPRSDFRVFLGNLTGQRGLFGAAAEVGEVADDHGHPAGADLAGGAEHAERLAHGLAGGADPAGQLVLGERQRDLDARPRWAARTARPSPPAGRRPGRWCRARRTRSACGRRRAGGR